MVNIFRNRIVICIVFLFIAVVTVIVIFSMFMFIIVTIIKLLLGFFQDLNRRQSSPSHLRAIQTPKTWHPRLRTAPLTPHSISAGGAGRGRCSFGDVGPGAAGGREEPHTEFSPGDASQGVARAKFGETPCFSGIFFCFFLGGWVWWGFSLKFSMKKTHPWGWHAPRKRPYCRATFVFRMRYWAIE